MQLPQTACLALSGPLDVPESAGGRGWFTAFDDDWELIQVRTSAGPSGGEVGGCGVAIQSWSAGKV
jgi:hypothetical protein